MPNNPFSWGFILMTDASNVQGAILIPAGKADAVVGFEQSEEFEKALKAAGKNVTAVYFENEGHKYSRWQTNIKRARLTEEFLAKHLGGRAGGFDYSDLAARYLDYDVTRSMNAIAACGARVFPSWMK